LSVLNKNGHHFFMPLNLKQIKNSGYQLGLEAELNSQLRALRGAVDAKKYGEAVQICTNAGQILSELSFLVKGTDLMRDEKPCVLTSPEQSSKQL
jgi:hypothetical protein